MVEGAARIRAEGIFRRFGRRMALRGVSAEVGAGEILVLLGPNGSGKTTLLRVLAGVLSPTAGRAWICGLDVFEDSGKARRRVGYLPENTPLYGEMRVVEFLRFRGRLRGLFGGRLALRLRSVLEACGLAEYSRAVIHRLPRGLRQRVGFADCLLHEPDVLLLDEPFSGVDPGHAAGLGRVLVEAAGVRGCAVIFSTHRLEDAERLGRRALILDTGRVVAMGTPEEIAGGATFSAAYRRVTGGVGGMG